MNDISIAFASSYGSRGASQKYMPMVKKLGNKIYKCYGLGFPRGYKIIDEPIEKMVMSRIPDITSRHIVLPLSEIFMFPRYYSYLWKIRLFDIMFAKRIADDKSKILFTSPLLEKTIMRAKKNGKIVVLEAGNSEPNREHERVISEYSKYGIAHKYIYGDPIYKNICLNTFNMADYIISISQVSLKTYIDAGYDKSKFKLISLAGTNFIIQQPSIVANRKRAFISTAYHSFIKGTHRLLLAWKKANIKNVPLLIVGNLCEDMEEFIEKYGPFENVVYVGHRNDLDEWYKQYDAVGVLLSLSEGAVRVTPEMMSFGFPMITSLDASCDIVKDGKNGFIVNYDDEDKLIEKLTYFANNWNRVHELIPNVIDSVKNRSLTDYSLEVSDFLETLC